MKPVQIPRALIILSLFLIAVIFLAGVLHAFESAHAASSVLVTTTSRRAETHTQLTPTPVPTSISVSGDTTGIIALAILIVVIVLVGVSMGTYRPRAKKIS